MDRPVFWIILIVCIVLFTWKDIYNAFPHKKWTDNAKPDPEASAAKVTHEIVGRRQLPKMRTTVYFNDGFRYIAHRSVAPSTKGYDLSVPQVIADEIVKTAEEAHKKAAAKKLGKLSK